MGTGKFNPGVNPAMDLHHIQEGVEILLLTSCYRNQDNVRRDGLLDFIGPSGLYHQS